jgi:hypothetical protein
MPMREGMPLAAVQAAHFVTGRKLRGRDGHADHNNTTV